jgi:xanthine dehydrogenase YagT iron-sulfur-binding subunit
MDDTSGRSPQTTGLSRRDFLRGSGVAAAATALAQAPLLEADEDKAKGGKADTPAMGPKAVRLSLTVNDAKMTTSVEPRVTLLDALRDYLDVTGCKRVCDRGTCGACTVLVDDKPVYSCTLLALEAEGKKIRTAESLVDGGKLDAVPAAFVACDAQQCGFCTPGFVVAMKAVLEKNPKATPAEVERGLAGNICRCGTYEQMRHAIEQLCKGGKKED